MDILGHKNITVAGKNSESKQRDFLIRAKRYMDSKQKTGKYKIDRSVAKLIVNWKTKAVFKYSKRYIDHPTIFNENIDR